MATAPFDVDGRVVLPPRPPAADFRPDFYTNALGTQVQPFARRHRVTIMLPCALRPVALAPIALVGGYVDSNSRCLCCAGTRLHDAKLRRDLGGGAGSVAG